ncbi:DUF2723 domain-containing protein [bacterium]|nr:DUF2723 domain-containing protein [bacterium]
MDKEIIKKSVESKISDSFSAIIVFSITLGLYILTLSPNVALSDSGELATVCNTLGIAHPTGYPLYTLLGYIFTKFINPPVIATNFMSAFFGAIATVFIFLILRRLKFSKIVSALSALFLPLGKIMWDISVITEVYSLSAAIIWCSIYFLICWRYENEPKFFVLFTFFYGLAFTNHLSAILFAPALFWIIMLNFKKLSLKTIAISTVAFATALTLYLYLPIRSAQNPAMNWGAPYTFARFFRHLTGWQYRVWMFSRPANELWISVKKMFEIICGNAGWIQILSIIGFIGVFIRPNDKSKPQRKIERFEIPIFLLLIFIFDSLYAMNYTIPDIAPYYLPATAIIAISFAGISRFFSRMKWLAPAILVIALGFVSIKNYPKCNRHNDWSAREYAENVLTFPKPNSLLILGSWDMYSSSQYLRMCENVRPNVKLLDFALLRRSWYIEQLLSDKRLSQIEPEAKEFLESVAPFESGEKYDAARLQNNFENLIDAIIEQWNGPVYAFATDKFFKQKYRGIPEGLLVRIDDNQTYRPIPAAMFQVSNTLERKIDWNDREKIIYNSYKKFAILRSGYLHTIGKLDECEQYLLFAYHFAPEDVKILQNILVVQMEQGKYSSALETVNLLEPFLKTGEADILRQDIEKRIQLSNDKML